MTTPSETYVFRVIRCSIDARIWPNRFDYEELGVLEDLKPLLLKYSKRLGGIVVGYGKITLLSNVGRMLGDMPYIIVPVDVDILVFAPSDGDVLRGTITSVGQGYFTTLVLGMFTATIYAETEGKDINLEGTQVEFTVDGYVYENSIILSDSGRSVEYRGDIAMIASAEYHIVDS